MSDIQKIQIQMDMDRGGVTPEGAREYLREFTVEDFKKIGDVIEFACNNLAKRIEDMDNKPKGYSITFGVEAGGEVGVPFVTKGTVGANFTVTLNWGK